MWIKKMLSSQIIIIFAHLFPLKYMKITDITQHNQPTVMSKCKAFRSATWQMFCYWSYKSRLSKNYKAFKDQHKTASNLIVITFMRIRNILEEATRLIIQRESS